MLTDSMIILIKFILLGLVQGITEPLPISSSGHLVIFRELFQISTPGLTFEILVHLGSLIAIILLYRKDIKLILKHFILYTVTRKEVYHTHFKLGVYLMTATMITGVFGLLLEDHVSNTLARPIFVGFAFIITAIFLWVIRHLTGHKTSATMTLRDAAIIGGAQILALIPGISRSGSTIVAGMLLGLDRQTTLRFSFLLFIPIGIGANILTVPDLMTIFNKNDLFIPYLIAFLTAIIATYYALTFFVRLMVNGKLGIFSIYCFILGIITILTFLS